MRRRLAMLLSATLVAGAAAILVPASPAAAGVHVCAGRGLANLGQGLTYPVTVSTDLGHVVHILVIQQPRKTSFGFSLTVGQCVNTNGTTLKTGAAASGTVAGWCGFSTGYGVLTLQDASGRFGWIGIGGTLIITGEVAGIVNAVPDTLAGHSCNNNTGASQFLIAGGAIGFDHCLGGKHLPGLEGGGTLWVLIPIVPDTLTTSNILPIATISVHTGVNLHIWTLVCVPNPVL
jgi:hypothetical protein